MKDTPVEIVVCTPEEAFSVSLRIPEFEPWYSWEKWTERLLGRKVLGYVATIDSSLAGFKLGYFEDDQFYSWVGGVVPGFRKHGVARALAEQMESDVRKAGCKLMRMKTRNRFSNMLRFAIGRGFYISSVEQLGDWPDWRITLYKNL